MAIKKNPWSLFNQTTKRPQTAGAVHVQDFYYDASAGLLAADIVDLGILIGGGTIVEAHVFTEGNFGAITANLGILTGNIGDSFLPDGVSARVLGTELYAAVALTAADTVLIRDVKPAALLLAPVINDRSIGLQVSADVAAAAGLKFHLRLFYTQ